MKITIEIPEEFEIDYKTDKFKDFFQRVLADMKDYSVVCGNYEKETAEMFLKAFKDSLEVNTNRDIAEKTMETMTEECVDVNIDYE